MDGSIVDLSKYRYENAKEDLAAACVLIREGKFKPL
jgi:hypothetical protein